MRLIELFDSGIAQSTLPGRDRVRPSRKRESMNVMQSPLEHFQISCSDSVILKEPWRLKDLSLSCVDPSSRTSIQDDTSAYQL